MRKLRRWQGYTNGCKDIRSNKKDVILSYLTELRPKKNVLLRRNIYMLRLRGNTPSKPKSKNFWAKKSGAETQTCTGDARIFSPALYYLSYLGKDL